MDSFTLDFQLYRLLEQNKDYTFTSYSILTYKRYPKDISYKQSNSILILLIV